jgi:hypothetical protein
MVFNSGGSIASCPGESGWIELEVAVYIDPKEPSLTPDERRIGFAAILARAALRWRGDVIIRSPSTSDRPSPKAPSVSTVHLRPGQAQHSGRLLAES